MAVEKCWLLYFSFFFQLKSQQDLGICRKRMESTHRVCMLSFRISVDVLPLSQPSGVKTGPDQLGKDG